MTKNNQKLAIAEFLGVCISRDFSEWQTRDSSSARFCLKCGKAQGSHEIEDYPDDLNSMNDAWGSLNQEQRIAYSRNLRECVVAAGGHATSSKEGIDACCENASAEHRAKAFVITIGKWTPTNDQ